MLGTDTNLAPYESDTTADSAYAIGEMFMLNGKLHKATSAISVGDTFTVGTNCAAVNASEVFAHDVQVNGTSVLSNGVANIPVASTSDFGAVKVANAGGLQVTSGNILYLLPATDAQIRQASASYRAIVPTTQHYAAFYGLAAAAGDTTQAESTGSVGTYTETAQSKIHDMLDAPVTVSGSTPTITAKSGIRYVCGEVTSLDFTPSATGICEVIFTSGTTPTVLTLPNTVKMPAWWNGVEASRTYEINILDGVYGAVMSWAT